jgi:murein DD-endopeptidase MepM/ murein hydrolase activator NlpD
LLEAPVGVQRVIGRLRTGSRSRTTLATRATRRSVAIARSIGSPARPSGSIVHPLAAASRLLGRVGARVPHETALPVVVALIVLAASVLSVMPDAVAAGPVGGPSGDGDGPRIAIKGAFSGSVVEPDDLATRGTGQTPPRFRPLNPEAVALAAEAAPTTEPNLSGFLADGTLVKPIAVDTSVADGQGLLRTHTVRNGETLVGIAQKYGVSMMTVWWANKISSKDALVVGQKLTIPPVDGLVVKVKEGDTLDAVAEKYKVSADEVYETNGLEDRTLVIGQTLVLPGAQGAPIPTPTPKPRVVRVAGGGGSVRAPATYNGGQMAWPVVGGGNYISQYFRSGHYGLDIAADYGSTVRAAASGTVTFAGWKNNGGGYQVWIAHGSGLFTTYNHMSAVTVGVGQSVGKGAQVGRIGQSGYATGPHLHFEVWRGPIWSGGSRVNPLIYL